MITKIFFFNQLHKLHMKILGLDVEWLGHDCFKIKNDRIIYFDPFQIEENEKADLILITHEHYDHCSPKDIEKIVKPETSIVAISSCKNSLEKIGKKIKEIVYLRPNEKKDLSGILVETIPAYNVNKNFHPKTDGKVGYVITLNGKRIYHAGDTDLITEMSSLGKIDIVLLPVSGTYVMTAEEAAKAVQVIKPKIAIPMHYGKIIGDKSDAEKFKQLVKICDVKIFE